MEALFERQRSMLQSTSTKIVRDIMGEINWKAHMLCLKGARGVGKSTLLRQYVILNYGIMTEKALYCSLDWSYFTQHSMLEVASEFYKRGGELLIFDEVHKYENWSREVKEIGEVYPSLQIFLSGSSLLKLNEGDADLSRRCRNYEMPGLSFREYLRFYKEIEIERCDLAQLLENSSEIAMKVNAECRPLEHFHHYLRYGFYPYYLNNPIDYYPLIEQSVNYVIDVELPQLRNVDPRYCRKIKSLLTIVSQMVPFEVDISKLATVLGLQRATVVEYLRYLDEADMLNLVYSDNKSVKRLQKPDKILLQNPNLIYTLAIDKPEIGTVRECFAVNQLRYGHEVEYGKKAGDFKVDGRILFEVGGPDKTFDQIANIPDSYVLADGVEYPQGKKLPLWMLGLLY